MQGFVLDIKQVLVVHFMWHICAVHVNKLVNMISCFFF
jgi:hypothetical protein